MNVASIVFYLSISALPFYLGGCANSSVSSKPPSLLLAEQQNAEAKKYAEAEDWHKRCVEQAEKEYQRRFEDSYYAWKPRPEFKKYSQSVSADSLARSIIDLGYCYVLEKKFSEAENCYLKVVPLYKEYPAINYSMTEVGNFYLDRGRLSEAKKIFDQIMSNPQSVLQGDSLRAINGLVRVYAKNQNTEAQQIFRKGFLAPYSFDKEISVRRNYSAFLKNRGELVEARKIEECVAELEKNSSKFMQEQMKFLPALENLLDNFQHHPERLEGRCFRFGPVD